MMVMTAEKTVSCVERGTMLAPTDVLAATAQKRARQYCVMVSALAMCGGGTQMSTLYGSYHDVSVTAPLLLRTVVKEEEEEEALAPPSPPPAPRIVMRVGSRVRSTEQRHWFTKHVRSGRPGSGGQRSVPPYSSRTMNQYAQPEAAARCVCVEGGGGRCGASVLPAPAASVRVTSACPPLLPRRTHHVPHADEHDEGVDEAKGGWVEADGGLEGREEAREELEEAEEAEELEQAKDAEDAIDAGEAAAAAAAAADVIREPSDGEGRENVHDEPGAEVRARNLRGRGGTAASARWATPPHTHIHTHLPSLMLARTHAPCPGLRRTRRPPGTS
jgi:hypothetical protein